MINYVVKSVSTGGETGDNSNNPVTHKLKQHFREQKMNEMLECKWNTLNVSTSSGAIRQWKTVPKQSSRMLKYAPTYVYLHN